MAVAQQIAPQIGAELVFIPALQKQGFTISLLPGGQRFSIEPKERITPALRDRIKTYRDSILAELQASLQGENPGQTVASTVAPETPLVFSLPVANAASQIYSAPGHDLQSAEEAYSVLFRYATAQALPIWLWEHNEPKPAAAQRPYCYLKPDKVGEVYFYRAMLADADGTDYVLAIPDEYSG